MVVPTFRGPGYGAAAGAAMAEGAEGRLAALLKNRELETNTLGRVLSNIEGIAGTVGSGALDPVLQQYSGLDPAKGPLLSTPYGGEMDLLRKQGVLADIASTNRSGTGGGGDGSGDSSDVKPGNVLLQDMTDGSVSEVSAAVATQAMEEQMFNGTDNLKIISRGKSRGVQPLPAAPVTSRTVVEEFDDGSVLYDDGSTGMKDE